MSRVPAKRWGQPVDLSGAVVFLASAASDYVSGTSVVSSTSCIPLCSVSVADLEADDVVGARLWMAGLWVCRWQT